MTQALTGGGLSFAMVIFECRVWHSNSIRGLGWLREFSPQHPIVHPFTPNLGSSQWSRIMLSFARSVSVWYYVDVIFITMNTATDTLNIAKHLRRLKFTEEQAEGIAEIVHTLDERQRNDLVTKDYLDARVSKVKNELIIWMIGSQITTTGLLVAVLS